MFCKKGVLRNFTICVSPATLLKRRLLNRCFPVNFAKFLRTAFFTEQLLAASENMQTCWEWNPSLDSSTGKIWKAAVPKVRNARSRVRVRKWWSEGFFQCAKSFRIWNNSGPHFPAFGLMRRDASLQSVQMRENAEQNNSEYGHFSCSDLPLKKIFPRV